MSRRLAFLTGHHYHTSTKPPLLLSPCTTSLNIPSNFHPKRPPLDLNMLPISRLKCTNHRKIAPAPPAAAGGVPLPPLDLTEDNVRQVLAHARTEFGMLFDTSVGLTGQVDLAELDGPFVKISLKGRFWHKRSTVLARIGNYLKQRIPEILEVDIEDEKQLDDSPENF